MNSVIQRCEALRERMEKLRDLQALKGQAEELDARRRELQKHRDALARSIGHAKVLADRGHLDASAWPDPTDAKELLARAQERLRADASRLTSGRDYKRLLERLEAIQRVLSERVTEAWSVVRRNSDPTDEQLLERMAQVPGQADDVDRVRRLRAQLTQIAATPPATVDAYEAFMRDASQLADAWNALDHGDLPDAVVRFFKSAQSRSGASVDLWTDEVEAWLEEHGMLSGVRLHFRGGS